MNMQQCKFTYQRYSGQKLSMSIDRYENLEETLNNGSPTLDLLMEMGVLNNRNRVRSGNLRLLID